MPSPARGRLTGIPPVQRESTVDLIAARLRAAIFSGTLPAGSHLGEVELSEQLGVSRGPLREAAQRLVSDRLLVSRRRGLAVASLGVDDVDDVYLARSAVERAAIRRLFSHPDGTAARTRALKALHKCQRRMARATSRPDARAMGDADVAFHRALVDAVGSPRLSSMIETLLIETRLCTFSLDDTFRVRTDLADRHAEIIEAFESEDEKRALAVIDNHLTSAAHRLRAGPATDGTIAGPGATTPKPLDPLELPTP